MHPVGSQEDQMGSAEEPGGATRSLGGQEEPRGARSSEDEPGRRKPCYGPGSRELLRPTMKPPSRLQVKDILMAWDI